MRVTRIIRDIFLIATAFLTLVLAVFTIYWQSSFLTITSRSMEPTIKAGDMVVTKQISTKEIKVRDVIVLPLPDVEGLRFSHRVVSVRNQADDVVVKTKGDGNPNPDSWELLIEGEEVPKVMAVIPTAPILNGPIERKWIYYGLLYGGAILGLYGSWLLLKR